MLIAVTIGVLAAAGVYLVLQRGMVRLILGMTLFSHAGNLLLLAAGIGAWRAEPLMGSTTPEAAADPVPQAFVLTAIVISMAATAFMLALAALGRSDDTLDEDMSEKPDMEGLPLQTLGRRAHRISPDSRRWAARARREGGERE